jgi:Cof subfamily protein (haloacid dehalogenase superfamily)
LSQKVIHFLSKLVQEGHTLLFVTGRTLFWSMHLLRQLPFGYYLAVLNGAYIIQMPDKKLIAASSVSAAKGRQALTLLPEFDAAVILLQGPDENEASFLFPKYASPILIRHLEARREALKENWITIDDPKAVSQKSFAAIRVFCLPETAKEVHMLIEERLKVHAPMMTDSFDSCFTVVQITHHNANKGHALEVIAKHSMHAGKIIACGDDHNDASMLEKADCAVVMNTAPAEVLLLADVIAPSAKEDGLITGLQQALARYIP